MEIFKKISCFFLLVIAAVVIAVYPAKAQLSYSTESMALGGGGTAYLTGYESLFVNPANLYIREKNYSYQISVMQGSIYFDSLLPIQSNRDRLSRFIKVNNPYSTADNRFITDNSIREELVDRSFREKITTSEFMHQSNIYWFGMKWVRPERSYAVAVRTRIANRFRLGKGLFSSAPVERRNSFVFDQSFQQQYQVVHEISVGYAESFTYLNGLIPQLSEFMIGIAPKVVIAGGYLDTDFSNRYELNTDTGFWENETAYSQSTSGILTDKAEQFFFPQTNPVTGNYSTRDLLRPTGFGLGLDVGITYLITFGDDFSILRNQNEPIEKSLRVSFSITDLGAVYHSKKPFTYIIDDDITEVSQTGRVSDILFQGAPNEHYSFLSQYIDISALKSFSVSEKSFESLLPASIQTGALFQYNRLKIMGDISYTLVQSAFKPTGITGFAGFEIRPFSFMPVRAGTRLAPHLPGYYSLGAGIETNKFDFQAALQLKSRRGGPTSEIMGASVIGLKFYL